MCYEDWHDCTTTNGSNDYRLSTSLPKVVQCYKIAAIVSDQSSYFRDVYYGASFSPENNPQHAMTDFLSSLEVYATIQSL